MTTETTAEDIIKELLKLSGKTSLSEAVSFLQLIPDHDGVDIVIEKPWYRSGGETYLTVFTLHSSGNRRTFALKACVPSSAAISIDSILSAWIAKRREISSSHPNQITPVLYASGFGVILEEYIAYSLKEAVSLSDEAVGAAADLIVHVASLGFDPRLMFADLRSRGSDAVIVDFGQDLGHRVEHPKVPVDHFLRFLRNHHASVSAIESARRRMQA